MESVNQILNTGRNRKAEPVGKIKNDQRNENNLYSFSPHFYF